MQEKTEAHPKKKNKVRMGGKKEAHPKIIEPEPSDAISSH